MKKKILFAILSIVLLAALVFFNFGPRYIDNSMNKVYAATVGLFKDYDSLPFIADLHCDMLLWDRNFLDEHNYGHVDLPRMQKANMAFSAFTIVSKTPRGINIEKNSSETDQVALLSFTQLRPPSSWFSIKARALHQINQLHDFAEESNGQFRVLKTRADLEKFIVDRSQNKNLVSGMLGLEGAHCLEGDLKNLIEFYEAGVRYIGLAHFFDNEWAGSAHGIEKGGLTEIGRQLIKKMDSLNIIVDLAHSSTKTIDEIFRLTQRPLIVSHTGVQGLCNNQRNLSDEQILEIGRRNGLIGIGLWETAVCGTDAEATAKSMKYVADKIGIDKVVLGSDYDGAIVAHFDVTGLPLIMESLKKEGFSKNDIELMMGGNIRNFFLRNLP
jgi:microsomal dipeptidase-like Zn-dependent dipeptidase